MKASHKSAKSLSKMDFVDHVETPLNACSLESLPEPVEDNNGELVWPLMLGCYELDEASGNRNGRLDLYKVPVSQDSMGFGDATNIIGDTVKFSGVLDGKWLPNSIHDGSYYYGSAHASGEIVVHKIDKSWQISKAGNTESRDSALCLALSWDLDKSVSSDQTVSTRIISSYSNGTCSIHQANFLEQQVELIETFTWDAHKMFHSPAEVWSACFTTDSNVVMTGGDESHLKIWDIRSGFGTAIHTLKQFEAGVTVLAPHPRLDHLVACGSYDETVMLLDLRYISKSKPKSLFHSDPVGGGLWRIKWHPRENDRLLLGAMHGGCRVVQVDGLNSFEELDEGSLIPQIQQEFTNHKSMAYGADWLVHTKLEAAASCSFYDRAMYMWKVN